MSSSILASATAASRISGTRASDPRSANSTAQELKLTVGSRVIVPNDTKLSGEISIASGSVLHPTCSLQAIGGPIHIGSDCIIEENVCIINSSSSGQPLVLGTGNHVQVGSTIEMHQGARVILGNWNTLAVKARVSARRGEIRVGNWCKIGVRVLVRPADWSMDKTPTQEDLENALRVGLEEEEAEGQELKGTTRAGDALSDRSAIAKHAGLLRPSADNLVSADSILEENEEELMLASSATHLPSEEASSTGPADTSTVIGSVQEGAILIIPDYSVLYSAQLEDEDESRGDGQSTNSSGSVYRIRAWSGEGIVQEEAAFAKHLEYLREVIPRANKLRQV